MKTVSLLATGKISTRSCYKHTTPAIQEGHILHYRLVSVVRVHRPPCDTGLDVRLVSPFVANTGAIRKFKCPGKTLRIVNGMNIKCMEILLPSVRNFFSHVLLQEMKYKTSCVFVLDE